MNRARFRHRTLLCSDRSFVPTISRIDAKKEQKGGKKTAEKNENRQEDRRSWAIYRLLSYGDTKDRRESFRAIRFATALP